jgi:hypothetical protein
MRMPVKKKQAHSRLTPRKKAFTFATNNGIPIQNKYGHRVKVKQVDGWPLQRPGKVTTF